MPQCLVDTIGKLDAVRKPHLVVHPRHRERQPFEQRIRRGASPI